VKEEEHRSDSDGVTNIAFGEEGKKRRPEEGKGDTS